MLVVLEMDEVVRFPSDGHFSLIGDLYDSSVSGPFNDGEGEYSSNEASLELVASHFDNHVLPTSKSTLYITFRFSILMKVPVVLPTSSRKNLPS